MCYDRTAWETFDRTTADESTFTPTLRQLVDSHEGWYQDGEEGAQNGDVRWLNLERVSGVYILWKQDDYCSEHDAEHLTAAYVGKAGQSITTRLLRHQLEKRVNAVLTTEISVWRCPNRQAKYIEQALLDHFFFPLNHSEMRGTRHLCHHISPGSWN